MEHGKSLRYLLDLGDAGDCYAGRLLAGLLCGDSEFSVLPPHFSDVVVDEFGNSVNEAIRKGMDVCFGHVIIQQHGEYVWLF